MKFTKMQGTGNDFIVLNGLRDKIRLNARLINKLCDRHCGIGADGVILILSPRSKRADFRMRFFNADGSEAEMCGNGIRCLGKFVYDHGLTRKKQLIIETLAGLKPLDLYTKKNKVIQVRVAMGQPNQVLRDELSLRVPLFQARQVRSARGTPTLRRDASGGNERIKGIKVLLGNPHYVIFVNDVMRFPVERYGPLIACQRQIYPNEEVRLRRKRHPHFSHRTNVEFVQIINRHHIKQRTWERGVGETLACGTGATAAVAAGIFNHQLAPKVRVQLKGGTVVIEARPPVSGHGPNIMYLTGPAAKVFCGEI